VPWKYALAAGFAGYAVPWKYALAAGFAGYAVLLESLLRLCCEF
jgi:hypothetical protein